MNYIKNKTLFTNPLILDGKKVFNPSEEQLLAAGYKRYISSEADPSKLDVCDCIPEYEETKNEIRLVYRYTFSETKAQKHYCQLAQDMMDAKAKEGNYDGIMSKCYELLEAVLDGEMDILSKKAFLAMLPVFVWSDESSIGDSNGQTA